MKSDILVKLLEREYLHGFMDGLLCAAANMEDCEWTIDDLWYAADVALRLIGHARIDWKLAAIVERRTEQHKDQQAENGKDENRG